MKDIYVLNTIHYFVIFSNYSFKAGELSVLCVLKIWWVLYWMLLTYNFISCHPQPPTDNGQHLDIRGDSVPETKQDPPSAQIISQPPTQSHSKLKSRPPVKFDQPNRLVLKNLFHP